MTTSGEYIYSGSNRFDKGRGGAAIAKRACDHRGESIGVGERMHIETVCDVKGVTDKACHRARLSSWLIKPEGRVWQLKKRVDGVRPEAPGAYRQTGRSAACVYLLGRCAPDGQDSPTPGRWIHHRGAGTDYARPARSGIGEPWLRPTSQTELIAAPARRPRPHGYPFRKGVDGNTKARIRVGIAGPSFAEDFHSTVAAAETHVGWALKLTYFSNQYVPSVCPSFKPALGSKMFIYLNVP